MKKNGEKRYNNLPAAKTSTIDRMIVQDGKFFSLLGTKTPGGSEVRSISRRLIEAIAAERQKFKKLDATRQFGIFSIFSTYADHIAHRQFITDMLVNDLAVNDHVLNYNKCSCPWSVNSEHLRPAAFQTLAKLDIHNFIDPKSMAFTSSLKNALQNLQDYEKTTFCILNGMWGIPISVCLMYLQGDYSMDEILVTMDSMNQIDDWEAHGDMRDIRLAFEKVEWFLRVMRQANGDQAA